MIMHPWSRIIVPVRIQIRTFLNRGYDGTIYSTVVICTALMKRIMFCVDSEMNNDYNLVVNNYREQKKL